MKTDIHQNCTYTNCFNLHKLEELLEEAVPPYLALGSPSPLLLSTVHYPVLTQTSEHQLAKLAKKK